MKKLLMFSIGMMVFAALGAHAQIQTVSLFTTTNDFGSWTGNSGSTVAVDSNFSADTNAINGIGNLTAPGASGTSGSLSVTWASGVGSFNTIAIAPTQAGNSAFHSAIDPGSSGNNSVAYTGTLYLDYSLPDDEAPSGGYFQLGILLQYAADGYFGTFFSSSTTDLGFKDENGQEVFQATIPYTINAGNFNGFGFAIMYNSNYSPLNSFHIDAISVAAPVTPPPAPPITMLFTTTNDFTPWVADGGDLVSPDIAWSFNNDTTNGLGNLGAIGATGTAGSLLIDWTEIERANGPIADGPDEETNVAFMQAVDPGSNPGSETSVSAYGNFYIVYSLPDHSMGGTFFQIGVNLAYSADGFYQSFFDNTPVDLHVQDNNGYEVYQATVPYTINAGNYFGFTPKIAINSNYQPTNGFHVASIAVSAAPAPVITGITLNGTTLIVQGTNGLSGNLFNLVTSTNLTLPLSQWTTAGSGTFYGSAFSVTNTITPGSSPNFYSIKVPPLP